ncbi:MAG: hypothetical protein P8012_02095 [Desulfobacterales bacterium]
MSGKKITREEQHCISQCINKFWGQPHEDIEDDERDREYGKCLSNCKICA